MTKTKREMMIGWLSDAHSMEVSLVENLEQMAKDADEKGKPEVKSRLEEHIEETKRHAEMVEECITELGGEVSKAKEMMGKAMGNIQGAMKSLAHDVLVKNALEGYAVEHFEIASYTSIFAAAKEMEEMKVAEVCENILKDELRMAEWALEQISTATREHLQMMEEEEGE